MRAFPEPIRLSPAGHRALAIRHEAYLNRSDALMRPTPCVIACGRSFHTSQLLGVR